LIYLPGGNPRLLVQRTRNRRVVSLFQKYNKSIIGNSAGALALCKYYVVIKGQAGESKSDLVPGLGLVDFAVSVHYKSSNIIYSGQSPDDELKALSERIKIFAIPERGALIYDNGRLKFIGNVYSFYHGKKTKCK
jgi:dipeptidase E